VGDSRTGEDRKPVIQPMRGLTLTHIADVMKSWGERRRAGKAEGEVEVEIFPTQLTSECNGMVRGREIERVSLRMY